MSAPGWSDLSGALLSTSVRDFHGAPSVYQKIGIEKWNVFDVVPRNQVRKISKNSLRAVRIKTPFVKDLVSAVVALIRATYACRICQLPDPGHSCVHTWINEMVGGSRKVIDIRDRPFWFIVNPACMLEG